MNYKIDYKLIKAASRSRVTASGYGCYIRTGVTPSIGLITFEAGNNPFVCGEMSIGRFEGILHDEGIADEGVVLRHELMKVGLTYLLYMKCELESSKSWVTCTTVEDHHPAMERVLTEFGFKCHINYYNRNSGNDLNVYSLIVDEDDADYLDTMYHEMRIELGEQYREE